MQYFYSCTPTNNPNLHHQTELSDITDEQFEYEWKEHKFTWYQRVFQVLCFFIFFGPLRVVIGLSGFALIIFFVTFWRYIQLEVLKIDRKYCKKFLYFLLQISVRFISFAFGHVYIKINGKVDPEARVIVSNHTAWHDPFLINLVLPVSAVCKAEVTKSIFRYMVDVIDPIYVKRDHPGGQTKLILDQANNMEANPVLIYPEATITNCDITLKFHRGAFITDKKVQPILITFHMPFVPKGWNTFAWTTTFTPAYFWQCISMPLNWVTINVLPAMQKSDYDGTADTFAKMAQLAVSNFQGTLASSRSSHQLFRKEEEEIAEKEKIE